MSYPLEKKKLKYVDGSTISALDATWVEDIEFLPYCSPHCVKDSEANVDPVWVEAMSWLNEDLQHLLQMNHHKFWCQVIHDTSLQQCLDSYLQHGPRSFDPVVPVPDDIQEVMKDVHRRVFAVLLRLSTHKEDSENFLSPDFFAETVYNRHLVDLPKLMDLCVIYGEDNKELVSKMVDNFFRKQLRLEEDWRSMVASILSELTAMSDRVTSRDREVLRLGQNARFSADEFADVVVHLADFAATLRGFVSVYPRCVSELMRARFTDKAVEFYETVVPRLRDNWHVVKDGIRRVSDPQLYFPHIVNTICAYCESKAEELEMLSKLYVKERLRSLKCDLAWLVHECLCIWYLAPPPVDSSGVRSKVAMDGFVAIVSEMASEPNFLKEYKRHFDVITEVKGVQRDHPEMPEDQFEYLLSALKGNAETSLREAVMADHVPAMKTEVESTPPDAVVVESLVSKVKDLLPHLGAGFIKVCLREFGNNPETVINKVLEDSLPLHIQGLDFSMAEEESVPSLLNNATGLGVNQADLVDKRENIYDGDEFDVFRKPAKVDLSRVHVGKKFDASTIASVLDDKSHLQQTREQYVGYRMETGYENQVCNLDEGEGCGDLYPQIPGFDIMYEDEYDDTYDSQNIGAADDATDEQFAVKRLNTKGLFGRKLYEAGDEEEKAPTRQPPSQFPIILKRPDDPHRSEQLKALQSVKGYMSETSKQTNSKGKPSRASQDTQSGSKEGQEWRRKRDKANWRARHKEEEGGVVEVKRQGDKGDRVNWHTKEKESLELRGGEGKGARTMQEGQRHGDWKSRDYKRGQDRKSKDFERGPKQTDAVFDGKKDMKSRDSFQERVSSDKSFVPKIKRRQYDEDRSKPLKEISVDGERANPSPPSGSSSKNPSEGSQVSETSSRASASGSDSRGRLPTTDKEGEKSRDPGSSQKHSDLRSRQIKDRNKASRANHNRKNMADKKRRGGMM